MFVASSPKNIPNLSANGTLAVTTTFSDVTTVNPIPSQGKKIVYVFTRHRLR